MVWLKEAMSLEFVTTVELHGDSVVAATEADGSAGMESCGIPGDVAAAGEEVGALEIDPGLDATGAVEAAGRGFDDGTECGEGPGQSRVPEDGGGLAQ